MTVARAGTSRVPLAVIGVLALVLQVTSAIARTEPLTSPNAATAIGLRLAAGDGYRAYGRVSPPSADLSSAPYLAYQLPGEPLYLAAAFRLLPEPLYPFLHVPIVVLLIVVTSGLAFRIGGQGAAYATGGLLCLDPFLLVHGPVWDDAVLASMLTWSTLASALTLVSGTEHGPFGRGRLVLVAVLAAAAALTRAESQAILGTVGVGLLVLPPFRPLRRAGVALTLGVLFATGGWTIRNAIVLGVPVIGTTHDGKTLFESTYRTARPAIRQHGVAQEFDPAELSASFAGLERLTEVEADALFRREAWRYIREHPIDVANTASFKIVVSLVGARPDLPWHGWRNLGALAFNAPLIGAGLAGGAWWFRRRQTGLPRSFVTLFSASIVGWSLVGMGLGPVGLRYRITLGALLALLAALGIAGWMGLEGEDFDERGVVSLAAVDGPAVDDDPRMSLD